MVNSVSNQDNSDNIKKIALVGNPNVGKSIIFQYLTGQYVEVSNFPGTTVEIYCGKYKNYLVFDTPGIYSLASFNDEEKVAMKYILDADIIINVIDANHLERDLFLTLQLIDMGKKVIVSLNIIDELEKNKISLDILKLSKLLGLTIIPTIATKGIGLKDLANFIEKAALGNQSKKIIKKTENLKNSGINQSDSILILENNADIKEKHNIMQEYNRDELYFGRRIRVNEIVAEIIKNIHGKSNIGLFIGRFSVHPVYGLIICLLILYSTYLFIGKFVAGTVVDYTEKKIGHEYYEFQVKKYCASLSDVNVSIKQSVSHSRKDTLMHFENGFSSKQSEFDNFISGVEISRIKFDFINPFIAILVGEFGILTMTISYLFLLLLPLVLGFYFTLALLEDTGYLPRLAALVDKLLTFIGLNGKAIIPIILGFGCVSMATMTTRILGSKRERTIATTILQLAIPCSAQLGVIATLLSRLEIKITIIYAIVIFLFLAFIGTLMSKIISGDTTPLLIDLPGMRIPKFKNVLKKTIYRSYGFMKEASPWFFFGALLISVLQITNILNVIIDFLHPLVVHWLRLPPDAGIAFVMGLVRRDFGAAGLYDLDLSPYQVLVALITLTLFVPCVTSLIIMFKERGLREGLIIWLASLLLAFLLGGVIAQIVL